MVRPDDLIAKGKHRLLIGLVVLMQHMPCVPCAMCRVLCHLSVVTRSSPVSFPSSDRPPPPLFSSFVPDHLSAPLAVVDVVSDFHHAAGGCVVRRRGLDGPRTPETAEYLDGDHGALGGVHAVPYRRSGGRRGEVRVRCRVGVGGRAEIVDLVWSG